MGLFSSLKKNKGASKGRLEISDDSGFIGIINSHKYQGFVSEDWELDEVLEKFRTEINKGHCAIWSTGEPNAMSIQVLETPGKGRHFREAHFNIQVTENCLWLANYTDLTMVAQFENEPIPSDINSHLGINLENGSYDIHLRQMSDPEAYEWKADPAYHFELIFQKQEGFQANQLEHVLWWNLDDPSK